MRLAGNAEMRSDDSLDPQLVAERALHGLGKASPRSWKGSEQSGQDALELEHRFLVEDDRVELSWLDSCLRRGTIRCWREEKTRRSFDVKTFFLNRADRHAVDDQCRGASW